MKPSKNPSKPSKKKPVKATQVLNYLTGFIRFFVVDFAWKEPVGRFDALSLFVVIGRCEYLSRYSCGLTGFFFALIFVYWVVLPG